MTHDCLQKMNVFIAKRKEQETTEADNKSLIDNIL